MKKKPYETPAMTIDQMEQETHLLEASGEVNATMNDVWEEETI